MEPTAASPVGRLLLDFGAAPDRWYTAVRRTDGSVLLRVYGLCDFVLSRDLSTVTLHLVHGADPGMRSVITSGTLLALQLYLRGRTVLHASAVEQDGLAIGFIGHSGMGKSTLAALLCTDGARVVTDDVLPLVPSDVPRVPLGASELRLRPGSEAVADGMSPGSVRRRTSADQRTVLGLRSPSTDDLPLAALVVPRPNREDRLAVERLEQKAALFTVLRFPRLMGWCDPAVLRTVFEHVSRLVQSVPVLVAHVPWGPPFREDTASEIWSAVRRHSAVADPSGTGVSR